MNVILPEYQQEEKAPLSRFRAIYKAEALSNDFKSSANLRLNDRESSQLGSGIVVNAKKRRCRLRSASMTIALNINNWSPPQ